ncbi:GspH/FimT family pseudopilin [Acaryochloris thomasi]|nr:GspH/FimT family pseudopilin [Acaryochloris thomasi]
MVIIGLIVGIFAAISVPSFLGWLNRKKVDDVIAQVEGALKEAQSEAIKQGQICEVDLGVLVPNTITARVQGTSQTCLPTGPRNLEKLGVSILTNNETGIAMAFTNGTTVEFSPRGTTTTNNLLVFYRPGNTGRCLAISSGLGIVRIGDYTEIVNPNTLSASNCETSG